MKKNIMAVAACTLCAALSVPFMVSAEETFDTGNMEKHKIGVIVYNTADAQVLAFRDYLENYIELCFPDVDFLYSSNVNTPEQEMEFIQLACDEGVEGILSFNSYDLKAEVELCEKNEVYYMRASAGVEEDIFKTVEDNPYFLGSVGPTDEMEYEAGYNMAKYFLEGSDAKEFFIPSGGAGFGVTMHVLRTQGILDAIEEASGAKFAQDTKEIAASPAAVTAQAGDMKVCVAPGFLDSEMFLPAVQEAYAANPYGVVLSVYPLGDLVNDVEKAEIGVIDCYSEENRLLFTDGIMDYVTGKFSSTIGPSFAAMYNAVTGYADDFRDNGKAFKFTQGFWTSDSMSDYEEKYAYSSSIVLNAYSADDLLAVCKLVNPDATYEDLKNLAEAYTFEDAVARRNN